MHSANSRDSLVKSKLILRRTRFEDIDEIYTLIKEELTYIFGRVRILNLLEKTLLSLTITDESDKIVAFACFSDHPNFHKASDHQINWLEWLRSHFELDESVNNLNSFFIWYFAAEEAQSVDAGSLIMREVFNMVPFLQNCFLICPQGIPLNEALITSFYPLGIKLDCNKSWRGCVAKREHHNQLLHVREARVEDNDDLIHLFNELGASLKKDHGEYFVAEFVKNQTEHKRCLVAEVEGKAVGFMSINSDFDIDILIGLYDLDNFNGLRNCHEDDVVKSVWETDKRFEKQVGKAKNAHEKTITEAVVVIDNDEEEDDEDEDEDENEEEDSEEEDDAEARLEKEEIKEIEQREEDLDQTSDEEDDEERKEEEEEEEDEEEEEEAEEEEEEIDMEEKVASDELTVVDSLDETQYSTSIKKSDSYVFDSTRGGKVVKKTKSRALSNKEQNEKLFISRVSESDSGDWASGNVYYGEVSCVCVELYTISEKFANRAGAFLLKIFETFPHKTYCIVNLPYLTPEPPLMHFFSRVTPQGNQDPPNVLYVFSSPGVLDNITIRLASPHDLPHIKRALSNLLDGVVIMNDVIHVLEYGVDEERVEMKCFVAALEGQIVGLAVIKREEDIEYIRSHYNIENLVEYHQHSRIEYQHLVHFLMNPAFKHYSTFFMQELLRVSRTSNLSYYFYPSQAVSVLEDNGVPPPKLPKRPISMVLEVMLPVSARRQIQYNLPRLGDNAPSDKGSSGASLYHRTTKVTEKKEPFHLMFISRKNLLNPRTSVNARIVVVGASDTALAFLETFIFNHRLRFNNLTLISTHGLPGDLPPCKYRSLMLSHNHCYSPKDMAEMGMRVWTNVVVGKMIALNREEKVIRVSDGRYVHYDYLFLTTGNQYLVTCPPSMHPDSGFLLENTKVKTKPAKAFTAAVPKSIFVINDEKDAASVLKYAHTKLTEEDKIVIHGDTLDAYCCLNGLLASGVPAYKIVFAVPPASSAMSCINNPDIDCSLLRNIAGIPELKVVREVCLEGWVPDKKGIYSAIFSKAGSNIIKIHCKALVLYTYKGVDQAAFHAINCSTLVFDMRLVIEANFRTNDPFIWGAGPLTKYRRFYYCEDNSHSICNSKEIGYNLANSVMYLFDPAHYEAPPTSQSIKLTPPYTWPKIRAGVLPGNYYYLHVHKPAIETELGEEEKDAEYGHLLRTGSTLASSQGYFRLHINQLGFIQTVTCYSSEELPSNNLVCLYGLHQKYLNNIVGRWFEGLIKDLYVFLSEPWSNVIYHDRFIDLREEIREIVLSKYAVGLTGKSESLDDFLRKSLDRNLQIEEGAKMRMQKIFKGNGFDKRVQRHLTSYLAANHHHLPMFVKPL